MKSEDSICWRVKAPWRAFWVDGDSGGYWEEGDNCQLSLIWQYVPVIAASPVATELCCLNSLKSSYRLKFTWDRIFMTNWRLVLAMNFNFSCYWPFCSLLWNVLISKWYLCNRFYSVMCQVTVVCTIGGCSNRYIDQMNHLHWYTKSMASSYLN